ncbi:MAG TPA: four helix bundle protein [bacterium]|nr:four helix bundle protein [bacterium]
MTNNIAEGFERKTNKELINYLYIAKGSAAEVRSMLSIGKEPNYFSEKQFDSLYLLSLEISKLLSGFIKTL